MGGLPEPKGNIGPIRAVKTIKRKGEPVVKKHSIHLYVWEPAVVGDLKSECNTVLLRDVFGLEESEIIKHEQELYERLW